MGNSSYRSPDLLIYIETQKQYYNSGSCIEGVVFVEAKTNFSFDALYLRVQGDEWCQWFEASSKNRQKYTGSENFYAVEHILEKYPGTVQVGKYAYPFSLQLSQNIPGSFESKDYDAKIEYKLAAYFVNYSKKENTQIQYIPLFIRQPFRQEMASYQGASKQAPTSCGCFHKGKVKLEARFDRNVCYDGESVNIEVMIDNSQGSDTITGLLIDLVQNIFVCSNTGVNRTIQHPVSEDKLPLSIPKGGAQTLKHTLKIQTHQNQTAIGTLVANHYRIEVSPITGFFNSQNPCIYSPIFILKQKDFDIKNVARPLNLSQNLNDYHMKKFQVFKAPQYWFKKNLNLSVMNFRLEDGVDQV